MQGWHRRESLNQMAMVKGRLEPRSHFPCCLSPPTHSPSWKCSLLFAVCSSSPWPSLIAVTSALMLMDFRSGSRRQHVQKVVMEQGPLCIIDAIYLQPEPQDWGHPAPHQSTGPQLLYWSPSSLPLLPTSCIPGIQGSCSQCTLLICLM